MCDASSTPICTFASESNILLPQPCDVALSWMHLLTQLVGALDS
jgi:hypothetical protein